MNELRADLGKLAAAEVHTIMWIKLDQLGKIVNKGIGQGNGKVLANAWIEDTVKELYAVIKKHQVVK